jgi:beta-glucosidase
MIKTAARPKACFSPSTLLSHFPLLSTITIQKIRGSQMNIRRFSFAKMKPVFYTGCVWLAFCLCLILPLGAKDVKYQYPFQNPIINMEKRIDNLLSLMNREEKIRCLSTVPDIPRLGVVGTGHVEGLHGLAMGEVGNWGRGKPLPTTQFPQAIGLGETWDADLVREVGRAEGREVRYLWESPRYKRGGLVVRAPNADIGRDPRWGRTEECFGEDAYFNGTMATAMTRGLQGDDPKYLQCASLLKHFLSNSNEEDRVKSSSDYDQRLFREYYSEPFRMAMQEGRAQGVMAAYNAVNGIPCAVNPFLKEVVMKQWGHDGIICTDGGALKMLVTEHERYAELDAASAGCVKSGINQFLDRYAQAVSQALDKKLLSEAELDKTLRGVFRVMIRLGQLDPPELVPYRRVGDEEPWNSREHKELALLAAQKSVVLLKNEKNLLPLDPKAVRSVAVIGPYADKVIADWYGGDAPYLISPLEGIRKRLGKGVKVEFARGDRADAAVRLARSCDAAVVCAGNHPLGSGGWGKRDSVAEGKESFDRESMELRQEDLIKKVLAANPRTIVALISSFPFTMTWTAEKAPAILHLTHSGQESGTALAQALFGDINPGGRLVMTWPCSMDQLPPMMDYDIRRGRTYMYFTLKPLYAFGYGLSYTSFAYSNLKLSAPKMKASGEIKISLDLANSGTRAGDEVAQLYVKFPDSKVQRPFLALKGFQRVTLEAGQVRKLEFTLKARDLAYWEHKKESSFEQAKGSWKVEPGKVKIFAGASSDDLRLNGEVEIVP